MLETIAHLDHKKWLTFVEDCEDENQRKSIRLRAIAITFLC